jgi:hypothetical protein
MAVDGGLKDVCNVSMTTDQIAKEAVKQRESNDTMSAIIKTRETLHNVTVGNKEERDAAAQEARKKDRNAKALKSSETVQPKKSKWYWLTGE